MTQGSAEKTKKAFAAGLLGLGAVSLNRSGSAASESSLQQDAPSRVLVFAYDYNPELSVQRITTLQQGTTNGVLSGIDAVGNPDDYVGYVVRYQPDGEYTLAFVRQPDSLPGGASFGFDPASATFFDPSANLLQVGISGTGGETPEDGEGEDEETQEEVMVTTTTPENDEDGG